MKDTFSNIYFKNIIFAFRKLQCSRICLENPRDRGAWWVAVYGVAQSQTRLKWLRSSSSDCHILWRKEYVLRICLIHSCGVHTDSCNVSLGFCSRHPQMCPYSSVAYNKTWWFPVVSGPNELFTCHLKQEISMVLWKELCSKREGIWPLSIPYTYLCGSMCIMLIWCYLFNWIELDWLWL